jgi:hypothetical protein
MAWYDFLKEIPTHMTPQAPLANWLVGEHNKSNPKNTAALSDRAYGNMLKTLTEMSPERATEFGKMSNAQLKKLFMQLYEAGTIPDFIKSKNTAKAAETVDPNAPVKTWWEKAGYQADPSIPPTVQKIGGRDAYFDMGTYTWKFLDDSGSGKLSQEEYDARSNQDTQANLQQMYAADPYKYWVQNSLKNTGAMPNTPWYMSQLSNGQVNTGDPWKATPLAPPSPQWWNNLLPSEQQTAQGAAGWMGVNPEDFMSIYKKMIPGREFQPVGWQR